MTEGPGRPRRYEQRVRLEIRMEASLRDELRALSEKYGVSMSHMAVRAIQRQIKETRR